MLSQLAAGPREVQRLTFVTALCWNVNTVYILAQCKTSVNTILRTHELLVAYPYPGIYMHPHSSPPCEISPHETEKRVLVCVK